MSEQDSPAARFFRDRIMVWPAPDGYVIRVNNRGGLNPLHIEGDEMDAILALGKIKRLEVKTTDIRIEVVNK